jgi:hypothetical protein
VGDLVKPLLGRHLVRVGRMHALVSQTHPQQPALSEVEGTFPSGPERCLVPG